MIDLAKLDDLKELIQNAESFSEPWNFFYDHFGDHGEFFDLGKRVKSPLLTELCKQVARKVYGSANAVTHKTWIGLAKQHFIHGSAHIGDTLAVVMFFTDIDMGMLSFTTPQGAQLMRFTSQTIKTRGLAFPTTLSTEIH